MRKAMKKQGFRFRLIALLLTGLIVLAFLYGLRMLPAADSGPSLREAVLRLTNPESRGVFPSPIPSGAAPSEAPSSPESSPYPTDSAGVSPAPENEVLPFAEAISLYFSSSAPPPEASPSVTPSGAPAAAQ